MRNIYELIGIIKGISFDGVINDREVTRLQSWVDRNRNLAYEQRQVDIIKLVDDVLEDHVIDEIEKKQLISIAEEFLDKMGDDSARIYELNGIIEGIICDGEVNEAEIRNLKNWMDEYGDLIKDNKETYELRVAIYEILEDGIVTEEEQQRMLEILKDRIRFSQFETKLEYLCKMVKEKKNVGVELIDILNNESAINEIHRRAENQLMMIISSPNGFCVNREIIVLSLVLIAMLEYDGNYYGSVRETYRQVYSKFSEQKVEGMIRSILGRYKKQNESGTRERIINVALENAIVPKNFLSAFFEFIFDIYKLNFDYDLPEEPYEDFEFVFEGLRSNMLSDGDDISINVTQKTYKLIASTKQLITKEDGVDAVIKLSILIVKLIDRRFWDKEVKIFNPYLKVGYEGWEKQLKETGHRGRIKRDSSGEMRSRWEPKFALVNNSVYLVPPAHRIKSHYDYRQVAVVVLNDEEEIYYDDNCYIKEIIGGYQIEPQKIEIDRPLGKLKYRLQCGDEIIFDSKDKLYRNCIVFNDKGQEVSNNTDFEGTAYFVYKDGDAELKNILTKEFFCIGFTLVRMGDAVSVGSDVFNFSSMVKPGIFGQLHKNCQLMVDDEKWLPVYKEANIVAFEAENGPGKFEVVINGKSYKLSDMQYKTTLRENITKYVVELGITESGVYSVEVNLIIAGKKNRVLREEFIYDKELFFETEMFDETCFGLKLNSGIIDRPINKKIYVDDFELELIRFKYAGHECAYILPLDLGFYSIDKGEWDTTTSDLWIDDISLESRLRICDSECDGMLVYTEDGILAEDNIAVVNMGAYKEVAIGFLNSYKASNRYVLLLFTVDGKKKYGIFCYNKCVIDIEGTEIQFSDNPKQIAVTPVFHGKDRVFFEIMDKCSEKVYMSKALSSGQTEVLSELDSFEEYTFNFHEKTKILQLRKNTLIYTVNKTFYAQEDFVGRVFKIDRAYFDQYIRGDRIEKVMYFNKAYVRITDALEDNKFEGEIFVKTIRGEWHLDKINPVEIEICSDIVDETMDVYMTNCGDGLLMDFEKHGILNSMDHPTAPDIFLFNVSMKEVKK